MEHIASQSEVIRAIVADYSLCLWGPAPVVVGVAVDGRGDLPPLLICHVGLQQPVADTACNCAIRWSQKETHEQKEEEKLVEHVEQTTWSQEAYAGGAGDGSRAGAGAGAEEAYEVKAEAAAESGGRSAGSRRTMQHHEQLGHGLPGCVGRRIRAGWLSAVLLKTTAPPGPALRTCRVSDAGSSTSRTARGTMCLAWSRTRHSMAQRAATCSAKNDTCSTENDTCSTENDTCSAGGATIVEWDHPGVGATHVCGCPPQISRRFRTPSHTWTGAHLDTCLHACVCGCLSDHRDDDAGRVGGVERLFSATTEAISPRARASGRGPAVAHNPR